MGLDEHYNADQLREPFTILRKTRVADGAGGYTFSEAQVGPAHFAFVRPLRGAERQANEQINATAEVRFVMYAAIPLMPTDVLLYNGTRYNITALLPPGLSTFREVDATSGGVT